MKIRNLLLGSVTAAGLMTGAAYAADLGVLTSVDVCDQLGISGLTISSETNCLKISGEVSYNFDYGVWSLDTDDSGGWAGSIDLPDGSVDWGYNYDGTNDPAILKSEVKAKLNFEATADSSFGPAKAVIKLVSDYIGEGKSDGVTVDEAFVSIGEGTVIMAGHKGSVFNNGDDAPLNWLGLFNSQAVNTGVEGESLTGTSNAIQITHDLGNGFSLAGGLENLEDNGTAVGVLAYKGDTVSAHVSVAADNVLEGTSGDWDMHAGITATLDGITLVAAAATDDEGQWNVLGSAEATFDMFTIAGSVEAEEDDYTGAGASITAEVSDGVKLNVGGRWADWYGYTSYELAAGAEAKLAEDLTLSGAVGYVADHDNNSYGGEFAYGWAKLAWAPGGGFTASVKGTVTMIDGFEGWGGPAGPGYKIETEFKKTFE